MKTKTKIKKQTGNFWLDQNGREIPAKFVNIHDKLQERAATSLLNEAMKIHNELITFKNKAEEATDKCLKEFVKIEKINPDKHKGNFTIYSFDKKIKITRTQNSFIKYDENLIEAARGKLKEFLKKGITAADKLIETLVLDAFDTTTGKLDVKRIQSLFEYRDKISDENFQSALRLIDKATRRVNSKQAIRVYLKNDRGEYNEISLNISSL